MTTRLVYDGECGFCRYTVAYAEAVTGNRVEYRSYQSVADEHPEVGRDEFAGSIQLFIGGSRHCGARAAFEVLAIGGRGGWRWMYRRLPGAAALFEWLYRIVSRHRVGCYRLARLLFGRELGPRRHLQTADWLYRGIVLCGALAFASFWWQVDGLIGADGIMPAQRFLDAIASVYGADRYWQLPTLLWVNSSNAALHTLCAAGLLACVVGVWGRLRVSAALVAYGCYLSLVHAGQVFMAYQWDILLVECFVVAAIAARAPTVGVWVARLLLFRFMLLSGAVKLLSGDPSWADASALTYHFETQPLPTPLAWYAHHLPRGLLEFSVHATLFIELVLPFFIFLPRNLRLVAGAGFVLLELLIILTGSYNFFNLLTIVLCVSLLDDGSARWLRGVHPPTGKRWATLAVAMLIALQGMVLTVATVAGAAPPTVVRVTAPLLVANSYGLFGVMTTQRDELVVEWSMDGQRWQAYRFRFKPGPPHTAPVIADPHQPRLDWQMWFAALGPPERAPWVYDFVYALLEGRTAVLALLADPPPAQVPTYIRVRRFRYRFTMPAERAAAGDWWKRGDGEIWLPPTHLRTPVVRHEPLRLD